MVAYNFGVMVVALSGCIVAGFLHCNNCTIIIDLLQIIFNSFSKIHHIKLKNFQISVLESKAKKIWIKIRYNTTYCIRFNNTLVGKFFV